VSCRDHIIARDDGRYPRRLGGLPDAPPNLYVRGVLEERPVAVAIVGARAASGHATATARALAAELAAGGALVVSGGAVGVDAAAHRGALDAGGATVAVLGSGLDVAYPARNRPLFGALCEAGGAVVSPFAPGVPPRPGCFVRRNRVIAGMVDLVVVIEANLGSGSLHTAEAARDYGRGLGAVPGTPGCEALIAQGAALVRSADDVAAALDGRPRRPEIALPEPGSERARVLAALDDEARAEDDIADCTGLAIRQVSRALVGLELEGLAVLLPGRSYVRSALARELGGAQQRETTAR
jgi:DNA processing protein